MSVLNVTSRDEHVQELKDISEPLKREQEHNMLLCHSELSHLDWSSRGSMPVYSGLLHFQCQVAYLKQ